MKKIPTLFLRNYDTDHLVRNEVTPGCEWVLNGEGIATEKWDGTCCMIRGRKLYKRYELKRGKQAPEGFEPAQEPDLVTGDVPGWIPVGDGPEDRWHREAMALFDEIPDLPTGTYELVGPKVQGNPYHLTDHQLWLHGAQSRDSVMRDFISLRDFLMNVAIEGIVWHHPDGRMAKLKRRDFGFKWPIKDKS